MDKQRLQEAITRLHDELSNQAKIDDETRQLLKKFTTDINQLFDDEASEKAEKIEPLTENLHDLILKFEAEHPELTAALDRVATALANLGI